MSLALLILNSLPQIVDGASHLWEYIREVRSIAQQRGEWTDQEEAAFLNEIQRRSKLPEYQPDFTQHT